MVLSCPVGGYDGSDGKINIASWDERERQKDVSRGCLTTAGRDVEVSRTDSRRTADGGRQATGARRQAPGTGKSWCAPRRGKRRGTACCCWWCVFGSGCKLFFFSNSSAYPPSSLQLLGDLFLTTITFTVHSLAYEQAHLKATEQHQPWPTTSKQTQRPWSPGSSLTVFSTKVCPSRYITTPSWAER